MWGVAISSKLPLNENPFQSPESPQIQKRNWRGAVSYVISSLVLGSLLGAGAMFVYSFVFVVPPWEPRLLKPDERWGTLFFVAETLLPISITLGIAAAGFILKFQAIRLNHRDILVSCFILAVLISANRPVVSRSHRSSITPMFEFVPDTLLKIVCVLFLSTLISAIIHWLRKKQDASESDL